MNKQHTSIYLQPAFGSDVNSGTKDSPLRTLSEASRRINQMLGGGPITIFLSEGIYAIGETTVIKPERWKLSKEERLTIRAEVLPDDPEWNIGRMPTIIHTMPLPIPPSWNGNPDPLGGAVNGMVIEVSHVTILGVKFLGLPVVETPQIGLKRRMYAIGRFDAELQDLEVAQCLFAGDEIVAPLHVGIIARGNKLIVHHCIFNGFMKDPVVFWSGGSTGHEMRNCIVRGTYGSSIYTAGIGNDLVYQNNIIDSCATVWVYQNPKSAQRDAQGRAVQRPEASNANPEEGTCYEAVDSIFANNRKLVASGVGAKMEFQEIEASFLKLIGTQVLGQPIDWERDQTKRNYLHPRVGSEAAKVSAGLFLRPTVD